MTGTIPVTNNLGGIYYGSFIKNTYYNEILALAGLPHFTFHALRHTFASRAMEQGMDAKTLSVILSMPPLPLHLTRILMS